MADALSGRFLTVFDDLDSLLSRMAEIDRDALYSLRVQKFEDNRMPAALGALLSTGQRDQN